MRSQSYFLDIVSGRFLDGTTNIPVAKPAIFSNEKRRVKLSVLSAKNNVVSPFLPTEDSRFKMRLGTNSLKLADATDVPTAPPNLITAQASVVTAPARQIKGTGVIESYTPVTASFLANISPNNSTTANVQIESSLVAVVTAVITCSIVSGPRLTRPVVKRLAVDTDPAANFFFDPSQVIGSYRILDFTANLNTPIPATFSTGISGGTVTTINITAGGSGYQNGTYNLTFTGGSPSSTATANVSAVGGEIVSVSIVTGGSGYSSAPTASLFTPDKAILNLLPTNDIGLNGTRRLFRWVYGTTAVSTPRVSVRFSSPDTASTVTKTTVPSAFIYFVRDNIWEVELVSGGYGYVNAPTVTHDAALCSTSKFQIKYYAGEWDNSKRTVSSVPALKYEIDTSGQTYIESGGMAVEWQPANGDYFYNLSKQGGGRAGLRDVIVAKLPAINERFVPYGYDEYTLRFFGVGVEGAPEIQPYDSSGNLKVLNLSNGNYGLGRGGQIQWSSGRSEAAAAELQKATSANAAKDLIVDFGIERIQTRLDFARTLLQNNSGSLEQNVNFASGAEKFFGVRGTSAAVERFEEILSQAVDLESINVFVENRSSDVPTRYATTKLKTAPRASYSVFAPRQIGGNPLDPRRFISVPGGGGFEPSIEFLDYGAGYNRLGGLYSLTPLKGLKGVAATLQNQQGGNLIFSSDSPFKLNISVTTARADGFINTPFSYGATVISVPNVGGSAFTNTDYYLDDLGFGYTKNVTVIITESTEPISGGRVLSARLTNTDIPVPYEVGEYECTVSAPPSGGRIAKVNLVVDPTSPLKVTTKGRTFYKPKVIIIDPGAGYTSAPAILAPTNIFQDFGTIISASVVNSPAGYEPGIYEAEEPLSAVSGGDCSIGMSVVRYRYSYGHTYGLRGGSSQFENFSVNQEDIKFLPPTKYKLTVVEYYDERDEVTGVFRRKARLPEEREFDFPKTFGIRGVLPSGVRAVVTGIGGQTITLSEADVANRQKALVFSNSKREITRQRQTYDAMASEKIEEGKIYIPFVRSGGYGYTIVTASVTMPSPSGRDQGRITSIVLQNTPVKYDPGVYDLTIATAPTEEGNAKATFEVSANGVFSVTIVSPGFGYSTRPTVTAPGPNARNGLVKAISLVTAGAGYAPGVYELTITTAPAGGETAEGTATVDESGIVSFEITNEGFNYVSAPSASVATPNGNIIKSITITCGGSYYTSSRATPLLIDSTGVGAVLNAPVVYEGKLNFIQVISQGYGYSTAPVLEFLTPEEPILTPLEQSQIEGDFNITTASANAILTTASERDVLLEVYETDGTNEQVIAQGIVSLKKRVA